MEKREEPYSNYFVQSPSSGYHDPESEFRSPSRSDSALLVVACVDEFPRYSDLLRYSGNKCVHEDDEKMSMPLRSPDSGWWIILQILWRFLFSFGVALLVFYVATQPPHPNISLRIGRLNQFLLEEGVDSHGVSSMFLTCNCSTELIVDNKSNVFGLHIHPPSIKFFFGPLNFAKAQGTKLYASSHESTTFQLYIGTKNRAVYGAGREMEDMLQSRAGLPLILRMNLISDFRVVWNIINPKYHHNVECLLLLSLNEKHDQVTVFREKCRLV
uniref:Late embryogenesis abundant protein LEA-2 subgroup domain-containing protein n=1 Tax=Noccaea caerulescens TaxID=107243 RepID=A0A1J3HY16_NOCCA